MRKVLKLLLIIVGVLILAYLVYLVLGRPPIPLPARHVTVSEGTQLYDFVKAAESEEVTITLTTNGEINALSADASLLNISYTPQTLDNVLGLASKIAIPANMKNTISTISKFCPLVRFVPKLLENFYYHIVRYQFTFVFAAN